MRMSMRGRDVLEIVCGFLTEVGIKDIPAGAGRPRPNMSGLLGAQYDRYLSDLCSKVGYVYEGSDESWIGYGESVPGS